MSTSPTQLSSQAIQAALTSNWEEAVNLNQLILETEPNNIDALNRLARAHFELGDIKESKKLYESALKQDPYNQIAFKFLKRIEAYSKKTSASGSARPHNGLSHIQIDSSSFIEEPGKTKLVNLIKVAEPQRLFLLSSGEIVNLTPKNRGIVVTDNQNRYLGALPDDLSHRMLRFMKGGNKYQACIKTIKNNSLSILIRETFRSAKFRNQPSFLDNLVGTLAYSSDHIVVLDDLEVESSEDTEEENNI